MSNPIGNGRGGVPPRYTSNVVNPGPQELQLFQTQPASRRPIIPGCFVIGDDGEYTSGQPNREEGGIPPHVASIPDEDEMILIELQRPHTVNAEPLRAGEGHIEVEGRRFQGRMHQRDRELHIPRERGIPTDRDEASRDPQRRLGESVSPLPVRRAIACTVDIKALAKSGENSDVETARMLCGLGGKTVQEAEDILKSVTKALSQNSWDPEKTALNALMFDKDQKKYLKALCVQTGWFRGPNKLTDAARKILDCIDLSFPDVPYYGDLVKEPVVVPRLPPASSSKPLIEVTNELAKASSDVQELLESLTYNKLTITTDNIKVFENARNVLKEELNAVTGNKPDSYDWGRCAERLCDIDELIKDFHGNS